MDLRGRNPGHIHPPRPGSDLFGCGHLRRKAHYFSKRRSCRHSRLTKSYLGERFCAGFEPGSIERDWREDLFYKIYVRSFADSDGDGIGDFRGLTSRLPYLDELDITGIWLMPMHPSPSDHGYDVTDYRGVNPQYGTKDDFKNFLDAAQSRGIKVILDYVMNHSSNQHPWFVQSAANNPIYRDFYRWSATKPTYTGPWGADHQVWHARNGSYFYGIFWSGMPDINYDHQPVKDSIFAAVRY